MAPPTLGYEVVRSYFMNLSLRLAFNTVETCGSNATATDSTPTMVLYNHCLSLVDTMTAMSTFPRPLHGSVYVTQTPATRPPRPPHAGPAP